MLFEERSVKLAKNPFLLVHGDGGVGKSHLFGELVSRRMKAGFTSLFFLGQHFINGDSPWNQIINRLQLSCTTKDFLGALDAKAQQDNKRIIIFIDALNEAYSKSFWKKNIESFMLEISKYENIGLALSVRSEYETFIFPHDNFSSLNRIHHFGFQGKSLKSAIEIYFHKVRKTQIEELRFGSLTSLHLRHCMDLFSSISST